MNDLEVEMTFDIRFDGDFYIISMIGEDCEANICCTEKQFDAYVLDDLRTLTTFDMFYDYCCNHECALV